MAGLDADGGATNARRLASANGSQLPPSMVFSGDSGSAARRATCNLVNDCPGGCRCNCQGRKCRGWDSAMDILVFANGCQQYAHSQACSAGG